MENTQKKLYLSPDKKMGGVCAGIGDYFNVDPTVIRYLYFIFSWLTSLIPGLITYVILMFVIPKAPANYREITDNKGEKLMKSNEKMLGGICSGLAEFLKVDKTAVRVIFVIFSVIFGGFIGLVIYIAGLVIVPKNPAYQQNFANQNGYGYQNPNPNMNPNYNPNFNPNMNPNFNPNFNPNMNQNQFVNNQAPTHATFAPPIQTPNQAQAGFTPPAQPKAAEQSEASETTILKTNQGNFSN